MLETLNKDAKVLWFLMVGGLNTVLGFGLFPAVYWLLQDYQSHYVWMLVVCHITSVSFSFLTNKYLVFRTQGQYVSEITKFGGFHLFYFFLMIFLVPLFVEYAHCSPVVIQFSISVLIVVTSFFWYDRMVFLSGKR